MGNRAVITTDYRPNSLGLYLHWNGGRDSIEAFLTYCKLHNWNGSGTDALVKLIHVITNVLGSDSVELDMNKRLDCDNGDNGVYVIDSDWNIVDRKCFDGMEQHEYDLNEFIHDIDKEMPESERLGAYLDSESINPADIEVGDTITFINRRDEIIVKEVIGYGTDRYVNGIQTNGVPYVNLFDSEHPEDNPNNYLTKDHCREYRKLNK